MRVKINILALVLAVGALALLCANGETVICLHGNGSGSKWNNPRTDAGKFVSDLRAKGFLVIIPRSQANKWSTVNSASNKDIQSVLTEIRKQSAQAPFYLVGHSNGGAFASRFAVFSGLPIEAVQFSNSSGIRAVLASADYQARTLFCYSEKDRTTRPGDVLKSIRTIEARGLPVQSHELSAQYKAGSYRDNHEFLNTSEVTADFFAQ